MKTFEELKKFMDGVINRSSNATIEELKELKKDLGDMLLNLENAIRQAHIITNAAKAMNAYIKNVGFIQCTMIQNTDELIKNLDKDRVKLLNMISLLDMGIRLETIAEKCDKDCENCTKEKFETWVRWPGIGKFTGGTL